MCEKNLPQCLFTHSETRHALSLRGRMQYAPKPGKHMGLTQPG
jgi:hypothetical protein